MCDSTENGNGFEQNDSFSINFNQDFTYVLIDFIMMHHQNMFISPRISPRIFFSKKFL